MWMEEKETKLLAKLIERNQNICCGAGVRGNYYVTCVDNKRGVTYDVGCFFGRIVLREV